MGSVRPLTGRLRGGMWIAAGVVLPVGLTAAWIPLRLQFPNVDVALALVVTVMAIGAGRRRLPVVVAALCAALGFSFFDTRPFEQFAMSRQPDVETTIGLVLVGLAAGELAVRVARQRRATAAGTGDLSRVRDAATLLATGEELVVVIGAVAEELTRLLGLQDCWFEAVGVEPGTVWVGRDGALRRPERPSRRGGPVVAPQGRWDEVTLPVWGQGQVLGRFVLRLTVGVPLRRDPLLVAVTLADQVGAALMAQAPPGFEPPPGETPENVAPALLAPVPPLRVVR